MDFIQNMTPEGMADMLFEHGMEQHIHFCQRKEECYDLVDKGGGVTEPMCRKCLVEYLEMDLPDDG